MQRFQQPDNKNKTIEKQIPGHFATKRLSVFHQPERAAQCPFLLKHVSGSTSAPPDLVNAHITHKGRTRNPTVDQMASRRFSCRHRHCRRPRQRWTKRLLVGFLVDTVIVVVLVAVVASLYRRLVVSSSRGIVVSWYRGIVVSWYRGIVVSWYRGIGVS